MDIVSGINPIDIPEFKFSRLSWKNEESKKKRVYVGKTEKIAKK